MTTPSGKRALPPVLETATAEEVLEVIQFGPYEGMTFGRQYELYKKGVALGADGGLLFDGETVYILATGHQGPRIEEIDYFHGVSVFSQGAGPTAQMADDSDICSTHMISIDKGNKTIRNIIRMQRAFRSRLQGAAMQGNQ